MDDFATPEEKRLQRKREKAAREAQAANDHVMQSIMSTPSGRAWMREKLAFCGVFHSTFATDPYRTAFNEGERNVGLMLFAEIERACPEAYIQMLREINDAGSPIDRRNIDDDRNFDDAGRWLGDGDGPDG